MTRRRPRAFAAALIRPTPDVRWLALGVAALAALYGALGGPATGFGGL